MENYYDELVQLKQNEKISWVEFVKQGDNKEEFEQWCKDHSVEETEDNAQLFIEMTEDFAFENQ